MCIKTMNYNPNEPNIMLSLDKHNDFNELKHAHDQLCIIFGLLCSWHVDHQNYKLIGG